MFRNLLLVFAITILFTAAAFSQGSTPTSTTTPSSTTNTPTKSPIFRPNKDQIMQVQKILKTKKLYNGDADGKYNDDTRTGIKSFQKDNGLKETGTLNRATLEKFGVELTEKQKQIPVSPNSYATTGGVGSGGGKATTTATMATTLPSSPPSTSATTPATSTPAETSKKPAPFRANADQIKAAQKILKAGKMYTGDETGKLDDPTRDGLRKYQEANTLKVTGTLNAATLEKMGIALTDAQKANVAAAAAQKN